MNKRELQREVKALVEKENNPRLRIHVDQSTVCTLEGKHDNYSIYISTDKEGCAYLTSSGLTRAKGEGWSKLWYKAVKEAKQKGYLTY